MGTDAAATNNVSLMPSPRAYQAGASSPAVQALAELRRARRLAMACGQPTPGSRSYSGEDWSVEGLTTSDVATSITAAVARASHVLKSNRKAAMHHNSDTEQENHEETRKDRWDEDRTVQGIANRLARMLRTRHWVRQQGAAAASPKTPVCGVKGGPCIVNVRSRSAPSVRYGSRSPDPQDRARSFSVLRRSVGPGLRGPSRSGLGRRFDEIDGIVRNVTSEHNQRAVRAGEAGQFRLMDTAVEGLNSGGSAGGHNFLHAPSSFHNTTSLSSSFSTAISSSTLCNGEMDDRTWSAINAAVKSGYRTGVRNEIERSRWLLQRLQMMNGGLQQRRHGGFNGGSLEARAIWGKTWVWARLTAIAMSRDAV
ncbi:hypothetical protein VaNZ11_013394 [Volvox africanus]|uniref:Uncharacterized protein n=1 Tax=Volvox africanus TaxID=51714 RepID=A0ABQ5SFY3_9CHLO|nr:hypothetical protein VaNZ11_013394 [Volvox africanus]